MTATTAPPTSHPELQGLVALDGGWIHGSIYADADIYKREQRAIFGRAWLFVGHECQIPSPGNWIRSQMGDDPIIVVRDRRGNIGVHLNQCTHRGMPLCRADSGTDNRLTCPNHGWVFELDGRLAGVRRRNYYGSALDRDRYGLTSAAKVETYRGLIFATFDENAVPLAEWLGDMAWYLDIILDRSPNGTVVLGGCHRWMVDTNWKLPPENQAADMYHAETAHKSVLGLVDDKYSSISDASMKTGVQIITDSGHFIVVNLAPDDSDPDRSVNPLNASSPEVDNYYRATHAQARSRLGDLRDRIVPVTGTIWPNLSFVPSMCALRVAQPRGPHRTEIWSWTLVDADAPDDVKDSIRRTSTTFFGPAGILEQDDSLNWASLAATSVGYQSSARLFDVSMGLGNEYEHPELPGLANSMMSEHNQRGFFRRWRKEMGLNVATD